MCVWLKKKEKSVVFVIRIPRNCGASYSLSSTIGCLSPPAERGCTLPTIFLIVVRAPEAVDPQWPRAASDDVINMEYELPRSPRGENLN